MPVSVAGARNSQDSLRFDLGGDGLADRLLDGGLVGSVAPSAEVSAMNS